MEAMTVNVMMATLAMEHTVKVVVSQSFYERLNEGPCFCQDVDECTMGTFSCHSNASCTNTIGSYDCECRSGFIEDGATCLSMCTIRK